MLKIASADMFFTIWFINQCYMPTLEDLIIVLETVAVDETGDDIGHGFRDMSADVGRLAQFLRDLVDEVACFKGDFLFHDALAHAQIP